MHVIVNITTKQSPNIIMRTQKYYCSFCGITMWSGQWPGPEPAGSGRAWASHMTIVLRAGPGLDIHFAGRVCTTAAGPGRAWASNHI